MITSTVGNYPKVAEGAYGTKVIGAISRWQRKELNDAELEDVFRDVTRGVIKEQEDAGLDVLTDGQIRWEDLIGPIAKGLEGFEINGLTRWFDNNVYYRRPILHKAPVWTRPILVQDYEFAAGCTDKPVKAILPGPYTFVVLAEDQHYKNRRRFALKMAEILNAEARALVQAGAPWVQFDEPALGFGKPDIKLAMEALKVATSGIKTKTAIYAYFGSLNGALQPLLRSKVDLVGVDIVSDPKALSHLRKAKLTTELAIGCLDARTTKLESVKALHELFGELERIVPWERLTLNPSCGLEFLPHTQALAKIRRLGEAARSYRSRSRRMGASRAGSTRTRRRH